MSTLAIILVVGILLRLEKDKKKMSEAFDKLKRDTELALAKLQASEQKVSQLELDKLALQQEVATLQASQSTGTADADVQALDSEVLIALGPDVVPAA